MAPARGVRDESCHWVICSGTMGRWVIAHRTAAAGLNCKTKSVIQTRHRLQLQFKVRTHDPIPTRNMILGSW